MVKERDFEVFNTQMINNSIEFFNVTIEIPIKLNEKENGQAIRIIPHNVRFL